MPIYTLFFALGAIIGSFLNVCIYRLPRGESVVRPRSHCPYCKKTIGWFDNIPLLSFILLKGRCRHCGKKISSRYFFVELISGILMALLWSRFQFSWLFLGFLFFAAALVVIAFIDLKFLLIPDVITYPGIALGLWTGSFYSTFVNSFYGLLLGGGIFYLLSFFGQLIIRREVLGGGDIKMMAMIGAFLGAVNSLLAIFLASLIGSIVGLTLIMLKIKSRRDVIPFGPFLSLGALLTLFCGQEILTAWEKLGMMLFNSLTL